MDLMFQRIYEVSSKEKSSKELEAIEFVKGSFEDAGHGNFAKVLRDVAANAVKRYGRTGENAVLTTLKMMQDNPEVKDNKPLSDFVSSILKGGTKVKEPKPEEKVEESKSVWKREGEMLTNGRYEITKTQHGWYRLWDIEKADTIEEFQSEAEAKRVADRIAVKESWDEGVVLEGILDTLGKVVTAPIALGFGIVGAIAGGIAGMIKAGSKLNQVYKKGTKARRKKKDSKGRQSVKGRGKRRAEVKGRKVRGVKVDPKKKSPKAAATKLIADKGGDKKKAKQAAVYLANVNTKKPELNKFWKEVASHIKPAPKVNIPRPKPKIIKMRKHKRRAAAISKKKKRVGL